MAQSSQKSLLLRCSRECTKKNALVEEEQHVSQSLHFFMGWEPSGIMIYVPDCNRGNWKV